MDHVSSLECLKLDSQSEMLDKDGGGKDLFSPVMVPLNCNKPIIGSKADESEPEEPEDEEFLSNESEVEELIGHECEYCLKVGDHFTQLCPYKHNVPKNAIVSTRCVVLCNHCGCHFRNSCCANCGRSDGCAVLMDCLNCGKKGEHMTYMCPSRKENPVCSHTIMDGGVVSPPLQIHWPKPIRSKSDESESDESNTDESETEQLIGHECEYCLKVGDHFTILCPYRYHVPKNAIVSKRCMVFCNCCGFHFRDSCCSSCGESDGCAVLMNCLHCGNYGEHMTYMCPSRERSPHLYFL